MVSVEKLLVVFFHWINEACFFSETNEKFTQILQIKYFLVHLGAFIKQLPILSVPHT